MMEKWDFPDPNTKMESYSLSSAYRYQATGKGQRTGIGVDAPALSSAGLVSKTIPRSVSPRWKCMCWVLVLAVAVIVTLSVNIYTSCCPWFRHGRVVFTVSDSPHKTHLALLQQTLPPLLSLSISMVSTKWGGFAARAAFLISSHLSGREEQATSVGNTLDAVKALQTWYTDKTGLWTTTGWWNSANCLTVLADWAMADPSGASSVGIQKVMSTTFSNAQKSTVTTAKTLSNKGMPTSTYTFELERRHTRASLEGRGFSGFINEFYDDEGWWALAWIRSWDVTKNPGYLDMAEKIFTDMKAGTDGTCGGGIWWSKEKKYKNAIANELYLSVAASLANRVSSRKDYYRKIAQDEWNWFKNSGMINSNNLINDGLTIQQDGKCVNNKMNTWSYNQGVILGGLVELSKATGDSSYLGVASGIANAAIKALSNDKGIIHEIDNCEPDCGDDGSQFKGIFVRNLHYLHAAAPQDSFRKAIALNAESIWKNDRNGQNKLGINWSGPAGAGKGPTAGTHSSALDVLVADITI